MLAPGKRLLTGDHMTQNNTIGTGTIFTTPP